MKIRNLILLLLLAVVLSTTVLAEEEQTLLFDYADVLTEEQESKVNAALAEASRETGTDIMIVTISDAFADETLADDYFYEISTTGNGVILLVSFVPDDNSYFIAARGSAWSHFVEDDEAGYDDAERAILSRLKGGRYEKAFVKFADACEGVISGRIRIPTGWILLSLIIGGILSFLIPMKTMKQQLKSVRSQPGACNYIRNESLVLTEKTDRFLYQNVSRVAKAENNRSGGGSHGRSGGGGRGSGGRGGRF